MFKATTLFEALITIVILMIMSIFISPIFILSDKIKLNSEAKLVQSFIYQIQNKARLNKQHYSISVTSKDNKWCMVAIPFAKNIQNSTACNCFRLSNCELNQGYTYYENTFSGVKFHSESLYPKLFIRIDGVSKNAESKCAALSLNKEKIIIGFDPYGVIYVPSPNKRSECEKSF